MPLLCHDKTGVSGSYADALQHVSHDLRPTMACCSHKHAAVPASRRRWYKPAIDALSILEAEDEHP